MKNFKNASIMKNVRYIFALTLIIMSGNLLAETAYKTLTFPDDNNSSNHVQNYTSTWTAKMGTDEWSISNFNNNQWSGSWTYIKCGRSGNASVAAIVSPQMAVKIETITLTIDAITDNKVNSIKLYTSTNKSSWTEVGTYSKGTGEQSVKIASNQQAANLYYKAEFDCASGSSNGLVQISKVEYFEVQAVCETPITITQGSTSYGTFNLSNTGEQCGDGDGVTCQLTNITPNQNWYADHVETTSGIASAIVDGSATVSGIKESTTITVVFLEKEKATLKLSDAGNVTTLTTGTEYQGDQVTLPSTASAHDGYILVGWSETPIINATAQPTNIYSKGATYTLTKTDQTLYAVFGKGTEGNNDVIWSENFGSTITDNIEFDANYTDFSGKGALTYTGSGIKISKNSAGKAGCALYTKNQGTGTFTVSGLNTSGYESLELSYWVKSANTSGNFSHSVKIDNNNQKVYNAENDPASNTQYQEFTCTQIPVEEGLSLEFTIGTSNASPAYLDEITLTGKNPDDITEWTTSFITYSDFAYKCTYDITYTLGDGHAWVDGYTAPATYDHNKNGDAIALPIGDNLADGQYFRGWYDNDGLEGDAITELAVTGHGDVTLYAAWSSVVNFHVQGEIATTQTIDNDGHVAGYTPTATCTGKKFMGWSTINQTELIQDPASLDLFTDFSDKVFSSSTDLYAVYAAYNGGKPSEAEYYKTNYFNEEERSFWNLSENASFSSSNVYSADGAVRLKMPKNSTDEVYITTKEKIENLSKISFWIKKTGGSNNKFFAQFSTDGTEWTEMNIANKPTGATFEYKEVTATMPSVQSAYVRIVAQPDNYGSDNYFYIDDVKFFYKPAQYWYSDYSTNCAMAESAKLSYDSPDGESEYSVKANPVGKTITISDPKFAGYTLDYVEIMGQQYNVGDSYILAHTVEGTAHWTLASVDVNKTDIYVTSTKGVAVQAHDVVIANNSKLTDTGLGSLEATSNNVAFAVEVTDGTIDAQYGLHNATITITYTPTEYNITETATISLKMSNDGTGAEPRGTFTVHGRSLPQKFVIATQTKDAEDNDIWVALPANMFAAGVYEGATIELDNEDNALASIQYQYSLTDRWETMSADAVRLFSNANNDKRCLYASKSTTNIEDYAKLTTSGPTANNYAWLLETDNLTNYKFKNLGRESSQYLKYSSSGKFGMYTSGNEYFQIFPVEVVTELGLRIIEWGTDNVLVSYDYTGVNNDMNILVKVGTPAERAINLSQSRIGESDLYNLNCKEIFDFTTAFGKTIRFKATESSTTKEISYTVPFIVTSDQTTANLTTDADFIGTPIVVTNEATLTVDNNATVNNFAEVTVYPGAKLNVPEETSLATSKLTLRGGYDYLNDNTFALPQALVVGAITQQPVEDEDGNVTTPTDPMEIHYQYNIDNAVFYDLAVPYDADIYTITDETGFADFSMWVENYDGEKRVSDGKGWVDYDEWGDYNAPLHVGTGYLAAVKPIHDRPHFMLDIPMSADLRNGEPAKGEFNVTAPGFTDGMMNNGLHANNVGWNFIANPYLAAFSTKEEDALTGTLTLQTGELVQEKINGVWTGNYVYSEENKDVRYVTTYDGEHYVQHPMSETTLMPFTGFFVQVSKAGNVNFTLGSRSLASAPAMTEETTLLPKETELIFTLKCEKEEDNLVLLLGNAFSRTNAYEFMNDQSKVFTGSGLKLYTIENTEELYANAMQYDEAQYIPVGVRVDAAGEYTFDRFDNDKWDNVESCLILDTRENNFIDLMKQPYTTQLEKGTNNDRFMLHLAMKVPTSPTSIFGTDDGGGGPQKIIHNSLMYIIMPDGRVYNAAGDQVNGKEVLK